jgi:integrating conjugative element protein (TIGR03756 family)
VRTSIKVQALHPRRGGSSYYSNTGENPWVEVRAMSAPNPSAQAGGDGTTNEDHENNLAKFKNADVIGHPGVEVFNQFVSSSGYFCEGAGTAFMPYLLSTLDTLAWRYNVPEMVYPEALIPGHARGRRAHDPEPVGQRLSARRLPAPDRRPQGRRRGGPARRRCRHAPRADSRLSAAARQLAAMATGRPAR